MKRRQLWCTVAMLAFVGCIVYITLISRSPSLSKQFGTQLFHSWREWMAGDEAMGEGILENIGLFAPFGYLAAAFLNSVEEEQDKSAKNVRSFLALMLGFLLSLTIELVQYRTGKGSFDVDDLVHNTLGTGIGLLAYRICALSAKEERNRTGNVLVYAVLPALMLAAGGFGCWKMSRMVVMTNLQACQQFWFSVDSVNADSFSGRCYFYDGVTPNYTLLLSDGKRSQKAEMTQQGRTYTATAQRTAGEQYEVKVQFDGYGTLPTGVFLTDGKTEYVTNQVTPPVGADGAPLVPEDAVLKACTEELGVYVYQSGDKLIWLVGDKVDDDTELIYHIYSSAPEKLPKERWEYGFDNMGFGSGEPDKTYSGYRMFTRPIPKRYPVSSIIVGLNPGTKASEVIWNATFRP